MVDRARPSETRGGRDALPFGSRLNRELLRRALGLGRRRGLYAGEAEDLSGFLGDPRLAALDLHLAEVQDVHGAVGAELDVDGALQGKGLDGSAAQSAGREVLGVLDEVLDPAGVDVD